MSTAQMLRCRDELARSLEGDVSLDRPIGPLSTYRVGGPAALFAEPAGIDDLRVVADLAATENLNVLVVGLGSNLLVADSGFDGLAVHLGDGFAQIEVHEDSAQVNAGAACTLPRVARHSVAHGLTGFEWAVGVPGSIGGAVRMNAGGHGSDMAASLIEATVMNFTTAESEQWTVDQLDFSYRNSAVEPHHCVVSARLQLEAGDKTTGQETLRDIVRWRREHQPGGQNAGSVFTNPADDSAGRLIDVSGCKGLRVGSAEVSTKHANFIQVDDHGQANDVVELMLAVRTRVLENTGVMLHAETHLIGFGDAVNQLQESIPSNSTETT